MTEKHEITLPVEFDGEHCSGCSRLFHASYGFICTAFDQLVDKTEDTKEFIRCQRCRYEFQKEEENKQQNLF